MPCNSDHMGPAPSEVEVSRLYCVIDELDGKSRPSHWWNGHHPEAYGKPTPEKGLLDELVAGVCNRLKVADPKQYSLELQTWWREHQEADAKRLKGISWPVSIGGRLKVAQATGGGHSHPADTWVEPLPADQVPTLRELFDGPWGPSTTLPDGTRVIVGTLSIGGVPMGEATMEIPTSPEPVKTTLTDPDRGWKHVMHFHANGDILARSTVEQARLPGPPSATARVWRDLEIGEPICAGDRRLVTLSGRWVVLPAQDPLVGKPNDPGKWGHVVQRMVAVVDWT